MFGQWQPVQQQPTYFLHDGGEPVLEMELGTNYSTVSAINVRGPDGLVARRQGGSWIYYEFDAQGSVSQRLNSSGTVLSSSVYDAYGAETNSGTPTDPFGYNAQWGYWYDRDTGMYLCQARWYDPDTARWVTRDPIGYAGGANLYGYCGGGPVGAADPTGLAKPSLSMGIALWAARQPAWVQRLLYGSVEAARRAADAANRLLNGDPSDEVQDAASVVQRVGGCGETLSTSFGRAMHKVLSQPYQDNPRYWVNRAIGNGSRLRPDVIDWEAKIVIEFKPMTETGIARGLLQAQRYAEELSRRHGGDWNWEVVPYPPLRLRGMRGP